jgi:hypothetical protein
MPDITQRKKDATGRLAQRHEKDYKKGMLGDPLGFAVYKIFCIGLGFRYNQMVNKNLTNRYQRLAFCRPSSKE